MATTDRRSALFTQQIYLLTVSALTPWASVGMKMVVAILPGSDAVLILGLRALCEQ